MSGSWPLTQCSLFQISLIREFARGELKSSAKLVRSAARVPRDSEVTARDLSFKSVWRELKGEGWTRKAPPGRILDDRYKYVRPGRYPNGTVGIDYVLGEEAVLEFYANGDVVCMTF
ncbi:hypothetical protein PI125_g13308 [Phytophthora idaei]|nr:hypothetical protein PI125_g13308 [Phytophthora idaei]